MRDIAVVMVTVNRSPGPNYLGITLDNLIRSNTLNSERIDSFHLFDSKPGMWAFNSAIKIWEWQKRVFVHSTKVDKVPNQNVADALGIGSDCGAKWVLFLEDDIDFCADFLDSVGKWLDENERHDRYVYIFGSVWQQDVPIEHFFGTQAFAVRAIDAASLSEYIEDNVYTQSFKGDAYDLLMHKWSRENWPDVNNFAVAVPSFVQHIGSSSVINPRDDVHVFRNFPGHEWSY